MKIRTKLLICNLLACLALCFTIPVFSSLNGTAGFNSQLSYTAAEVVNKYEERAKEINTTDIDRIESRFSYQEKVSFVIVGAYNYPSIWNNKTVQAYLMAQDRINQINYDYNFTIEDTVKWIKEGYSGYEQYSRKIYITDTTYTEAAENVPVELYEACGKTYGEAASFNFISKGTADIVAVKPQTDYTWTYLDYITYTAE